jgi:hypothetical protein
MYNLMLLALGEAPTFLFPPTFEQLFTVLFHWRLVVFQGFVE